MTRMHVHSNEEHYQQQVWHASWHKGSYKQLMKFGNWNITETTIEWGGEGLQRFVIEMQTLTETVTVKPFNDSLYKWIVLALNEDWLTDDDLYDLNFAFVFAAGASGQPFDYQVFDRTLEYQYNILDDEEQ